MQDFTSLLEKKAFICYQWLQAMLSIKAPDTRDFNALGLFRLDAGFDLLVSKLQLVRVHIAMNG